MVLHNSKWDRIAKYKYLKKYGLINQLSNKKIDVNGGSAAPGDSNDQGDGSITDALSSSSINTGVNEIEIERNYPEFDQEDEEDLKMIRKHFASGVKQTNNMTTEAKESNSDLFHQAEKGAALSELNSHVIKIGKQRKNIGIGDDSDFEDYMDQLSDIDDTNKDQMTTTKFDNAGFRKDDETMPKSSVNFKDKFGDKQRLLDKALK